MITDTERLNFLISEGTLNVDFCGNHYVIINHRKKFVTFDSIGGDVRGAIDKAILFCRDNQKTAIEQSK